MKQTKYDDTSMVVKSEWIRHCDCACVCELQTNQRKKLAYKCVYDIIENLSLFIKLKPKFGEYIQNNMIVCCASVFFLLVTCSNVPLSAQIIFNVCAVYLPTKHNNNPKINLIHRIWCWFLVKMC